MVLDECLLENTGLEKVGGVQAEFLVVDLVMSLSLGLFF